MHAQAGKKERYNVLKYLVKIEAVLSLIFIVLIIFSFDTPIVAIMTILSAVIHELGHIAPTVFFKNSKARFLGSRLNGFRISLNAHMPYRQELTVLLCGPASHFIVSLVSFMLSFKLGDYLCIFALVNFMTMLTNLFPISQYDGYKAIRCIIMMRSKNISERIKLLDSVSFSFCVLISLLSLYFILKAGSGYWVFALLIFELIKSMHRYNGPA
jgi:Zn-dependent protease